MTNNHPPFVEKSNEKISSLFQNIQLIRHEYSMWSTHLVASLEVKGL